MLGYARQTKREVGFVSHDKDAFAGPDKESLSPQLASDAAAAEVRVSYYTNLGGFIAKNSLRADLVTEDYLDRIISIEELESLARASLLIRPSIAASGAVLNAELDALRFSGGSKYEVAHDSFYAELVFSGNARITVQETWWVAPNRLPLPSAVYGSSQPVYGNLWKSRDVSVNVQAASAWEPESVDRLYRCTFELNISARVEGGIVRGLQIDRVDVKTMDPVPDLAVRVKRAAHGEG